MAKNVMKMLKPSPKRGKNAFDLSHRHVMGANFGELLPITSIETVPGDYIELNCADLIRAMPMVTSPFLRAKQHVDFWFVPYSDLWHQFNAFITQKSQPQSSALKDAVAVPHVALADMVDCIKNSSYATLTDVCGHNFQTGAAKIFNYLGFGNANGLVATQTYPDVNLWRLAAYNYIWYNEYRQPYYDDGDRLCFTGHNASHLFNFDDLVCNSYSTASLSSRTGYKVDLCAMLQLRYRCWKKDLFTGALPSTQFGNVSTVDSTGILNYQMVGSNVSAGTDRVSPDNIGNVSGMMALRNNSGTYVGTVRTSDSFDVLTLRRSQAVQIWRENALRAGNRVNDNLEAHFGERPTYQRDHRPTYIGSYDAPLNISDVNATAQIGTGGNQSLGDVAGKGISSLDTKTLRFSANDFGVIMGIFSLLPEAEYNAFGVDKENQLLDRFDYFAPEMENLGLEPVNSHIFQVLPVSSQVILGYAPRYYAYKQKFDKCFAQFQTSASLQIWCSPKFDVYQAISTFSTGMPLNVLYVNPSIFDVNFVADAATLGCQFLCDFFFDVEAVRPMTVLGLPTY